jgi:hypothetical protein
MNMKFLLKIEHWQLFIYLFIIPAVMIIHSLLLFDVNETGKHLIIEMILLNLFMVLYGLWFYVLNSMLQTNQINKKLSNFLKYNFSVMIIYTIVINIVIFGHIINTEQFKSATGYSFYRNLSPIIITAQAYSTILYLMTLYLLSKGMILKEQINVVNAKNLLKVFILFLISPIGIWFLQPRIQRIYENESIEY